MLSEQDQKTYLAICAKRRKVRRFLSKAEVTFKESVERNEEHSQAIESLQVQTIEFCHDDTISLDDYKNLRVTLKDALDIHTSNIEFQKKTQNFIRGLNNKIGRIDAALKAAKEALRKQYKGRGKVLQLERR